MYKQKETLQATYNAFTSELKTHKGWKWDETKKKSGVGILISDKIDIKTKTTTKDKGTTYDKRSIEEKDVTLRNNNAPNKWTLKHIWWFSH